MIRIPAIRAATKMELSTAAFMRCGGARFGLPLLLHAPI